MCVDSPEKHSAQNSNTGWSNDIILERDYLFFWPMADWESVLQTCLNKNNEWICESMKELHIPVNVSRMTLIYPWHKEKQLKHDITIYHFRMKWFQEKSWTNCSHKPHCTPKCWPSSVLVTQCQASWENLSQTQHILCSCLMIMNACMRDSEDILCLIRDFRDWCFQAGQHKTSIQSQSPWETISSSSGTLCAIFI